MDITNFVITINNYWCPIKNKVAKISKKIDNCFTNQVGHTPVPCPT